MFLLTHLSLVYLICCPSGVDVQEVVFGVISQIVEVKCSIPHTQPLWEGPPSLSVYFNADDSTTVNPGLSNKDRLSVNGNGNLVISSAVKDDGGQFRCAYSADSVLFDVKIGCRLLEIPQYGSVNSTFGYPGDTAAFNCDQQHNLLGEQILTCLADGSWSADEPECGPECCCCCICCFIVLIVCVVLGLLFTGGHIGLTLTDHEYSVKKIRFEISDTDRTDEAVCFKDCMIKVVLPECCICVVVIVIQIAVYFVALKRDCNEDCDDDCCGVVVCLVVTIIVSIVKNAIESGIIFLVVHVKGQNYRDQDGHSAATNNGKVKPNDTTNL